METPEKKLARALICQAIRDMLSNSKVETRDKFEALEFLTATYGAWKESREIICDRAGICPDRLRTNFMKFYQSGKSFRDLLKLIEGNRIMG